MSSEGGSCRFGNRSRSTETISRVSSTESVVWESQIRLSGSSTWTVRASATSLITVVCSGASPNVPSTSSWPSWPISRICLSCFAKRTASRCTLVTSGHVASMVRRLRWAASSTTAGDTPCAENTVRAPSGTSSSSSTNTTPRSVRVSTTCRLWTISLRTYTGAPWCSRAFSTATTARSTPAQ